MKPQQPVETDAERRARTYADLLRRRAEEEQITAAREHRLVGITVEITGIAPAVTDWDDLPSTP